jgi:hypothetical protein
MDEQERAELIDEMAMTIVGSPMAMTIVGSPLAVRIAQAALFAAEPWNATRVARAIYDQAEAMVAEGERRTKAAAKRPQRDVDAARAKAKTAIAAGAAVCGKALDCGGTCELDESHGDGCLCKGDDGDGCP